jgi:hypothetical protein
VSGISSRDQKFIRQILQQEISKRKTEILKTCEDQGIRSFVVEFDYTKVPVRVTCGSMDTFRPSEYADKQPVRDAWDTLLHDLRRRKDSMLIVRCHMAAGASEKSFVQYVPMDSFHKDGSLVMMKA